MREYNACDTIDDESVTKHFSHEEMQATFNGTVDILQNWGSLISPQATFFLSCESTSYIIQIIFIFYRFQRSWAAATSANI